jgi:alkylhydroperoxidase family enzyme
MEHPSTPRIAPLGEDERDERARELLSGVDRGAPGVSSSLNIFTTLLRHPRLFRRWVTFGGVLLDGALPARDRELLILRTAIHCGSDYEWGQHLRLARSAGISDAEIARVVEGPDAGWSEHESALLRAADELHEKSCISERTWTTLARVFDERQLIEVPMVVGQYHLVAFTLNSLGVEREPGVEGLPTSAP